MFTEIKHWLSHLRSDRNNIKHKKDSAEQKKLNCKESIRLILQESGFISQTKEKRIFSCWSEAKLQGNILNLYTKHQNRKREVEISPYFLVSSLVVIVSNELAELHLC